MIREKIEHNAFAILYALFFLGFFYMPSTKAHSNLYYVGVAFPFLVMTVRGKTDFRAIALTRIFLLSAVFLFYMWLSLFWARNFNIEDILQYGRRVLYILCFISATAYLVRSRPKFLKSLLMALCWTAAFVSVVYSVYYYMRNPFPENRLFGYNLLHNPIRTSSIYGVSFIACLYLVHSEPSKKKRVFHAIPAVPIFSYMLLSQARGPLISIVAALAIWQTIIFSKVGLKRGASGKFAALLALILAAIAGAFLFFPEFFRYFILERGLAYRLEIWGNFLEMIKSDPLFGYGLNADTTTFMSDGREFLHPHSVYMATIYYAGAVGLVLQLVLTGCCLYASVNLQSRPESFLITCSLLFGALCIATDGNTLIQHPKPFWIFFWFPVALALACGLPEGRAEKETVSPSTTEPCRPPADKRSTMEN